MAIHDRMNFKKSLPQVRHRLIEMTDYIKPFLPILECHMVNFYTNNLWSKNVPEKIKVEVEKCNLIVNEFFEESPSIKNSKELQTFIESAKKYFPSTLDVCLHEKEFYNLFKDWNCSRANTLLDNSFMSFKKSHEVEVMSNVIKYLSEGFGCSHILDLGGGKGYLGSVLALEHKLKVLSIDSSSSNTHAAGKRAQKMEKYWQGIRKRIETGITRKGKHWKANPSQNEVTDSPNSSLLSTDKANKEEKRINFIDLYKNVTMFVNPDTDVVGVLREKFKEENDDLSIALVGLHTCGNLGPSSIELFLKMKSVKLLLNVGCCYHLLTDKFEGEQETQVATNLCSYSAGFPMSQLLLSRGFRLTYNTRVVAAQSVDRIMQDKVIPSANLFYRALVEVLLVEKFKIEEIFKIGSIKCDSFPEYARKALKKFELQDKVTDHELDELFNKYEQHWSKLQIYFMMRVTLAPIVEAICLLDRLQYLHEQGIEEAYLVQLFDPVKSPRCYGILAVRD
ncbi:methyltransferase-like protein 25 [Nilaparvata lugens]|uniref:methyltransferase-like protein 25 n=1 Tax=Nilaparvata lugens TaxID=108931 RepID=UPI00193DED8D|nr:methyltransferase-like protein 25 [Nilaparvata lugens]